MPASVHRLTQSGLRNVLVHFGLLEGRKESRAALGKPPTRWVQSLNCDDYRFAPIHFLLVLVSRVLDLLLHVAAFDRL